MKKNSSQDNRKISHAVYGIIRNELVLRQIIGQYLKKEFENHTINLKILLLTGTYLLLFSSSYPDHAVVNEIVQISKKSEKPFLNAILRSIIRSNTDPELFKKKITSLKIRYSGSSCYIEKVKQFSDNPTGILDYLESDPVFHIRPNLNKFSYKEASNILKESIISFREIKKLKTFEIRNAGKVISEFIKNGTFYFQNSGSQLVSIIASKFSGKQILDCCAAPGTKSVTLHFLNPEKTIIANDINFKRISMLKNFIRSYKLSGIYLMTSNILKSAIKHNFDLLILDAPCSSSGTIRKNPDLKLKLSIEKIKKNSEIQMKMLKTVLESAPFGSHIIYSVCSFIYEESEEVIDKVVRELKSENPEINYSLSDISSIARAYGFNIIESRNGIFTLPSKILNNDLFYISVIKKSCNSKIPQILQN